MRNRLPTFWEDKTQREVVIESLKANCEVRRGKTSWSLRDRLMEIRGGWLWGEGEGLPTA